MSFDFSVSGMIRPNKIKIITFAMDQMKQIDRYAIIVDLIQLMFCFMYLNRIIFMKCRTPNFKGNRELEELWQKRLKWEGYSKWSSITLDSTIIIFFLIKFSFSLQSNYHQNEEMPYNKTEYVDLLKYADGYLA